MKYILILIMFFTLSYAQTIYDYGNIDMHGGQKDSLINKNSQKFGSKDVGVSNFLQNKKQKDSNKNKQENKKEDKVIKFR